MRAGNATITPVNYHPALTKSEISAKPNQRASLILKQQWQCVYLLNTYSKLWPHYLLKHITPSKANLLTRVINKKITPVKITISNWVVWEWSPTLFTTARTKTNSLQGALANASHTHSNQHRQTTTTSEDLLGESGLSNNSRLHTNKVCISVLSRGVDWRAREKDKRERKRELVWKWNWVESQIPPPPSPRTQVNWIIRSQGRYRRHLPWIALKTTSVWLHCGKLSRLWTFSSQ